jgi:nuclear pore complex protein Nup155
LTAKNTISVYKPTSEKYIQHVQTLSNLYTSAQEKAPGSPALTPHNFHIIGLHVVDPSESRSGVQLIALTANGVRLYFSSTPVSYAFSYGGMSSQGGSRPLHLIHVRLPPINLPHPDELLSTYRSQAPVYGATQAPQAPTPRPYVVSALENSCYVEGLAIAAQPGDADGTDFVLCMSPDLTRIGSLSQLHPPLPSTQAQQASYINGGFSSGSGPVRPPLTEYASLLAIPGRTWAMAPVPVAKPSTPSASPSPAIINELATQFLEPPRQFMVLTNVGLTFLVKRRAVDYLRAVIEEVQSEGNVQLIIQFRDR